MATGETGKNDLTEGDQLEILLDDNRDTEDLASESSSDSELEEFKECACYTDPKLPDHIPYSSVYDTQDTFRQKGYFIPAFPVTAKIVHAVRNEHGIHPIDKYMYTIEAEHAGRTWTVKRQYSDFRKLDNRLSLFYVAARIKAPFKKHRSDKPFVEMTAECTVLAYTDGGDIVEMTVDSADTFEGDDLFLESSPSKAYFPPHAVRESVRQKPRRFSKRSRGPGHVSKLPDFPTLPDSFIGADKLEDRKIDLQQFLDAVMHINAFRNHHETANFLSVSRLSFVQSLGGKHNESLIKKRPGGEYAFGTIRNYCLMNCCRWIKGWFILKDHFIANINPSKEFISDVFLFDTYLQTSINEEPTGRGPVVLQIQNLRRDYRVKFSTYEEAEEWRNAIQRLSREHASIWLQPHDFGSSFPTRDRVYAQWFVDGCKFMDHAANMLDMAKEEIFIAGWWVTPHIYMKRGRINQNGWRLDQILKRKAEQGVRVFVLVYREITWALPLNSFYTESYLSTLHPNIKVLRHPHHLLNNVLFWAHHEKLIIIDQKIAFIGGIDLCYGRWDDHDHRLTDLGGVDACVLHHSETLDTGDEVDISQIKLNYELQGSEPDLPTATILEANDEIFAQVTRKQRSAPTDDIEMVDMAGSPETAISIADIFKMGYERSKKQDRHPRWRSAVKEVQSRLASGQGEKLWVGKDYVNFIHKDIPQPEMPFDDFVDRTAIPRLPWHDIASVVYGSVARDAARHFVQRWNNAKADLAYGNEKYPFLLPKSYENTKVPDFFRGISVPVEAQILRSATLWSLGIQAVENSIQQAYVSMISKAQHYVYIENQFFVSELNSNDVVNRISSALFDRIVSAHRNKEAFRVYIVMPLLPAFEKTSGSLQTVLHWTYMSISKGPMCLLRNLERAIGDPSPYISFCSLRTWSSLLDRLVTEIIYIHSKLIIVDDRFCLIGSANINDRSQQGDRDSEVAVFVEDTQFTETVMNGKPYKAGTFAGGLRRYLFQEHLGLLHKKLDAGHPDHIDITDPASLNFFKQWQKIAVKNTSIFEQVFQCAPSDRLKSVDQFKKNELNKNPLADKNKEAALKMLTGLRGSLVQFPTMFLSESDLTPSIITPEGMMPSYVFT